jgi:protein O-mannosyl-transferase
VTAPAPSGPPVRLQWMPPALIFLVTISVFWPALRGEFVSWDDDINIALNPHIQIFNLENLRWMFTDVTYVRRYIPLTWLGFAIHNTLFGLTPASYHVSNILLHGLNAVLVFFIVRQLLRLATSDGTSRGKGFYPELCSAVGALLWALHPLRVEVVAWASARIYCQAVFFLLVSLLAYLHLGPASAGPSRRRLLYGLSVLAFAASLLTYPLALAFPLILVIVDTYVLKRFVAGWWDTTARKTWLEKLPYCLAVGVILAATLWARTHVTESWEPPPTLEQFGWLARVMQAFYIWAYYLWKPWWPVDLSPVYTALVWFRPGDRPFVLSAVLVVGITAVLAWRREPGHLLWALWLCYVAFLVPVLGLTEHPHYPTDRYSYFVNVLWAILVAAGLCRLRVRSWWCSIALAACLAVAGVLGVLSVRQTRVWANSFTLFEHMIAKLGSNRYRGDIHWRLGLELQQAGRLDEAIAQFSAAVQILPLFPDAHEHLGRALEQKGQQEQALVHYEAAARIKPTADRRAALAMALARAGRAPEAVGHYRAALSLKPESVPVLNNLAWILATYPTADFRNGGEAVQLAEKACTLTGYKVATLVGTLAAAYAESGRFAEAVETAQKAEALALAANAKEIAATNRQLAELYRQGRPYREEPKPRP